MDLTLEVMISTAGVIRKRVLSDSQSIGTLSDRNIKNNEKFHH